MNSHWTCWTPQNFHINLMMSIVPAEAEKSRLINVVQALAMNIHESLLTCLQKSDGFIWVCTMVVWAIWNGKNPTMHYLNENISYLAIQFWEFIWLLSFLQRFLNENWLLTVFLILLYFNVQTTSFYFKNDRLINFFLSFFSAVLLHIEDIVMGVSLYLPCFLLLYSSFTEDIVIGVSLFHFDHFDFVVFVKIKF